MDEEKDFPSLTIGDIDIIFKLFDELKKLTNDDNIKKDIEKITDKINSLEVRVG